MKKTFILAITLLIVCTFAFSEVKIGVVNAQEILQKSKKGAEIQKKIQALQEKKESEIKVMNDEITRIEKEIQSPALNEDARSKKAIDLDNKRKNLKRYLEDARNEFEQASQTELADFEKELMPMIDNIGKTKGFTMIIDLSRSGLVYMDPTIDITDEVVKAVDAKFPGGPGK
jgi:outer membrane protein